MALLFIVHPGMVLYMTFKRYIAASIDFVIIPDFILILFFLQFQSSLSRLSGLIIDYPSLISKSATRYYYQESIILTLMMA